MLPSILFSNRIRTWIFSLRPPNREKCGDISETYSETYSSEKRGKWGVAQNVRSLFFNSLQGWENCRNGLGLLGAQEAVGSNPTVPTFRINVYWRQNGAHFH